MTISAPRVARAALRALGCNRLLCCPGVLAKVIVFGSRFVPRTWAAAAAAAPAKTREVVRGPRSNALCEKAFGPRLSVTRFAQSKARDCARFATEPFALGFFSIKLIWDGGALVRALSKRNS